MGFASLAIYQLASICIDVVTWNQTIPSRVREVASYLGCLNRGL